MIRSILAAVDGSPASLAGMQQAAAWAKRLGAELRAMFVEDKQRYEYFPAISSFDGGMTMPSSLPEEEQRKELARFAAEREEIRQAYEEIVGAAGISSDFSTPCGNLGDILVAEARMVDLVVMGRRGRNDPPDSTKAGPTTESLIHDALRPVLVVPENGRTEGPVLFAFDGSLGVNRVVMHGAHLTAALNAKAVVVTADDDPEKGARVQAGLRRYLAPHGIDAQCELARGKPAAAIIAAAEAHRAGMIVMGAFGHSAIRELFFGSTTLDILEHTRCPVLLMA